MMRASTSLMPPPGKGTMNFTVRVGNAPCAAAEVATSAAKIAATHAATSPFIPASPAPVTSRSPPSRLVTSAEGRLALAQSRKLPHARDAGRARHRGKVRIVGCAGVGVAEVGRQLATAEIAALQSADRGIGEVVPHHPDDRQIVFDRG